MKTTSGIEVQSTGSLYCTDQSDNEMETSFSTFKPERPGMAAANPLYDSTYSLTYLPGCSSAKGISNPLYESTFSISGAKGDEDDSDGNC